jgi:hypothetical protein
MPMLKEMLIYPAVRMKGRNDDSASGVDPNYLLLGLA